MGSKRLGTFIVHLCCLAVFLSSVSYGQAPPRWKIEVVDSSTGKDAGSFSSLVIDRFGNFHLVYSNRAETALHYAFRAKTEKRWDKTTVDPVGGSFETLAVDSHGWAHIAYNSPKVEGLHYARWDGKEWQLSLIDPVKTNQETSIQLDSQDHPRITYYREQYSDRRTAKCLKYAYFDGKAWFTQTVDHRPGTGSWSSLALDRAEHPEISYSIATGFLGFTYQDQSEWQHTLVDFQSSKGKKYLDGDSSLAIGADGQLYVAYINASMRTINYAWREGAAWHQVTVDSLVSTGAEADRVSLKLDKSGHPHVVYYDSGLGTLKYATWDKDSNKDKQEWRREIIDSGNAGQYASLCLDQNDQPYVSYYRATDRELRIAHRELLDSVQGQ